MSEIPQPVATMSQIADAAGVSKMTVSLALRNHPKISPATRDRVYAAAERLGYRPNPLVQTLMAHLRTTRAVGQNTVIAWLTAFPSRHGWIKHTTHRAYFEGAEQRAAALGFKLEPFWAAEPGLSGARLTQMLIARGIRGVIAGPVPSPEVRIGLAWERFAAATVGYSLREPNLHRAASHLAGTMTLALQHLAAAGVRRIGFALPSDVDAKVNHHWLASFLAYEHARPAAERIPVHCPPGQLEDGLEEWMKKHRPEAIVSPNREFVFWLPKLGIRVPEDVMLVLLDKRPVPAHARLPGVDQNAEIIGAAAVDLVVGQLQSNETGVPAHPKIVSIEGSWAESESPLRRAAPEAAPAREAGARRVTVS